MSIIESGGEYRVYSDAVKAYNTLPLGTYEVNFHPMMGHSLARIDNMTASPEKMYGNGTARIERIARHYAASQRSVGVLLSGKGGMGKTMLMRGLTERIATEFNLPVIVVSANSPGLARFIDSFDECIVMFDEFEKIFRNGMDDDDDDEQVQFLSLFDGMSSTKRMYIVTVNDLNRVNSYMVNRTGRFHYHLEFTYPTPEDVAAYLHDAGIKPKQVKKVVNFTLKTPINYDHLRAIAFDLVNTGDDFSDIIGDLNISRNRTTEYELIFTFPNGETKTTKTRADLFSNGKIGIDLYVEANDEQRDIWNATYDLDNTQLINDGGIMIYPGSAVTLRADEREYVKKKHRTVSKVEVALAISHGSGYGGLV